MCVFHSLSDNPRLSVYATFPNRTIGVNLVVFRVRETLFSPVGTQCLQQRKHPPNSLAPPNAIRAFGVDLVGAECL